MIELKLVAEAREWRWVPCHCDAPCVETHTELTGWRAITLLVPPEIEIEAEIINEVELHEHRGMLRSHCAFMMGGGNG